MMFNVGDDEQSDWWGGDAGSVCGKGFWDDEERDQMLGGSQGGADRAADVDEDSDPTFRAILTGSFEHLSEEAKQAYRVHMQWIREGLVSYMSCPDLPINECFYFYNLLYLCEACTLFCQVMGLLWSPLFG